MCIETFHPGCTDLSQRLGRTILPSFIDQVVVTLMDTRTNDLHIHKCLLYELLKVHPALANIVRE